MKITPNTEVRELYVKVPFFIDFKINVFNLTNPEDFAEGKFQAHFCLCFYQQFQLQKI